MSLLLLTSQGCAGQRESGPDEQVIDQETRPRSARLTPRYRP